FCDILQVIPSVNSTLHRPVLTFSASCASSHILCLLC
uniref:Uncharacterized protein n=1 Tax=Lutzomyia longipalpis TaxID=7200 RepID=A0A1B0GJT3_LUTLO